jgi:hypothetical protein
MIWILFDVLAWTSPLNYFLGLLIFVRWIIDQIEKREVVYKLLLGRVAKNETEECKMKSCDSLE